MMVLSHATILQDVMFKKMKYYISNSISLAIDGRSCTPYEADPSIDLTPYIKLM
jgi:hypothetical protein